MAFTVTQRRREIGIRVALGGRQRAILGSMIARAMWQLAAGVVVGTAMAAMLHIASDGETTNGLGIAMLPGVAAFVLLVGLLAAMIPARRGLRIQPAQALREE